MSITGIHNIQVLRGLSSNRSLLSANGDGSVVDLYSTDDGSGRQDWDIELVPGYDDLYHVTISKGVPGGRVYLSCTSDGTKVDLYTTDDGSGRQRWRFVPVAGTSIPSYYNIFVSAGTNTSHTYLSCTPDGFVVDLYSIDDDSGRQRWQVQ
jgi:outer membrane protein assembly factor BamB